MITIIDYEVGNHQSIENALGFLGASYCLSASEEAIEKADAYILPGVGAFGEAMKELSKRPGIIERLEHQIFTNRKPLLGICLGMQIMMNYSEENGRHQGLGWIDGQVTRIPEDTPSTRVPHVGWTSLKFPGTDPLFENLPAQPYFYFDHSYQVVCDDSYVLAWGDYPTQVIAAIRKDNLMGVQFHPEKSQRNGLKLFKSFLNMVKLSKELHAR